METRFKIVARMEKGESVIVPVNYNTTKKTPEYLLRQV